MKLDFKATPTQVMAFADKKQKIDKWVGHNVPRKPAKGEPKPNLRNAVGLHPSNKTWANFLKDAELREEVNDWKHYISSNAHYIVSPEGDVETYYGYQGQNAFDRLSDPRDDLSIWAGQMGLTDKQLRQARKEGVTTIVGLRRIKKNIRGADQTSKLQAIHESRSPRSKSSDESQSNAVTIEPDDPRVEQWIRDQGRSDVRGIDTPRKGKSKKIARKSKQGTKALTQMRGLRR